MWQDRLRTPGNPLRIGISWRGGSGWEARKRSTSLRDWSGLFQRQDVQWVNLQYGDVSDELASLHTASGIRVRSWPDDDHFQDLEGLAAKIACLDLVITVSNVTAHLAGALGKKTLLILPHVPGWRWFEDHGKSPWYPDTTLIRQTSPGDWTDVFRRLDRLCDDIASGRQAT